jgi:hypothetical protein
MAHFVRYGAILLAILSLQIPCFAAPNTAPAKITINSDHVLLIDGRKVFPIGFTLPPAPDAKAPNGKNGIEELRSAGALFFRTGPSREQGWDEKWIERETAFQDAAAKYGMYCLPWLKELSAVGPNQSEKEQKLRRIVRMFRNHPGMGCWKGEDEPQWGNNPIPPLENAYRIIKEEDPNHPVWIVQAPRGTVQELKPYNVSYDIGGVDIYPISYPPGIHSELPNKEMSMVGDYTRKMMDVVEGKKPVWLTLQIAWSGVAKPGKTLRFPTFPQQRFMTYEAIINGARGLIYFGGNLEVTLSQQDKPLGWNWTFWNSVLRPVLEEIGDGGPLSEALVAPDSKLQVKSTGEGIEVCVREVGKDVYVLACKRSGRTEEIEFTGLPAHAVYGKVMFESPRQVTATAGQFKDWFAPFEVHVYKFSRSEAR